MSRSANCKTCGSKIKPRAKDMSVGAAVRLHYWRKHREVMEKTSSPQAGSIR